MDAAPHIPNATPIHPIPPAPCRQRLLIRGGHGSDYVHDFCPHRDQIAFDTAEITTYTQVLARLSQSGDDMVLTFDDAAKVIFPNLRIEQVSAWNFTFGSHTATLLEGTRITTERGPVAVEDLRPDEVIWTKKTGWQPLQLVIMEEVIFRDRPDLTKPVLIPAGALDEGQPTVDLVTAPTHRLLHHQTGRRGAAHGREDLVCAGSLVGHHGIRAMQGKQTANYYGVVLDRHALIQAEGCWVESLQVTQSCLAHHRIAARRLMAHLIGRGATNGGATDHSQTRAM